MAYRTIVAVIQNELDHDRLLNFVLPFARQNEAHVIGCHAEALPVSYTTPMGFPDVALVQETTAVNEERAKAMASVFSQRTAAEGIPSEWRSIESFSGDSALSALSAARSADLMISMHPGSSDASFSQANLETLLAEAGRPMIFVPPEGALPTSFSRILIAWNGSREATRAVFDALPLLKRSDIVEILTIDAERNGERDAATGKQIAASLSRHGINTRITDTASSNSDVATRIQEHVESTRPDLVVMGGYSRSWLREFLFGGTTRAMLKAMPAAIFMSR
ncbi:universal stress protein [Limoniibacter endophyticus]|uniref:Universal stress protein n=1 Tax=Limoniibacter endophyticus TaxID=1565040 RepID=A0A8J3DJX6_9HYPH|nr:universal stress protein [Limoniibacter endophyticus]GHC75693.1 universal stress protein [Limoniibacter endophyticus]